MESDLIPYSPSLCLPAQAALVLAPHPDDEVFGCGGAIASHVRDGIPITVVILTDGALYGDAPTRRRESIEAAKILGYGRPELWNFPDRGLQCGEELVQRLVETIAHSGADLVYAPSPWEIHPDHQQAQLLALEAVRRSAPNVRLAFYEIGAPLRPNLLLDITALHATKEAAMRCFASQLKQQNYLAHIQALNRYRTYTLSAAVKAAEAFWLGSAQELDQAMQSSLFSLVSPRASAKPAHQPGTPAPRPCFGNAKVAEVLPTMNGMKSSAVKPSQGRTAMVSVLIRTMDRASLPAAVASVAAQSFDDWEILIVNASGHALTPLDPGLANQVTMVLEPGHQLGRSAAANALLDAAGGKYALFLDDDDQLLPDHLQKLVKSLESDPSLNACYSDVQATLSPRHDGTQTQTHLYQSEFDRSLLQFQNYLPIHSVLFRLPAVRQAPACRFEEQLALFEDWDFWLQLAAKGDFRRVPGVSAVYSLDAASGSGHAVLDGKLREAMLQQFGARQLTRWQAGDVANLINWQAQRSRDQQQAQQEINSGALQLDQARVAIAELNRSMLSWQQKSFELEQNLSTSLAQELAQQLEIKKLGLLRLEHLRQLDEFNARLLTMYQSNSWRLTRPFRVLRRMLAWLVSPAPLVLLRNGLRAARGEIRRHNFAGFIRRLPHYLRNRKTYGAVLTSRLPQGKVNLFKSLPAPPRELRLHPDLTDANTPIDASISVVIPTLNAGLEFPSLLRKLRSQGGIRQLEIVIVDSGSQDQTVAWAKAAGCRVIEITAAEFSHSHARNLGASHASSDYLIFMVQDAYPIGEYWAYGMLRYLLDHAESGLVAASCSEYSRSDSDMMYDSMINTHYRFLNCHEQDRIGDYQGADHMALRSRGQLSDVACLISRQIFSRYGYQGDYAEDLDLGIRLIKDGHRVAMLASVKVVHSHNRPAFYYLKRSYVDVVFLVGMFDDFLIPVVESAQGLLLGIVCCARQVSVLLPSLEAAAPQAVLSTVLADWMKVCRQQSRELRLEGTCALGDERLDHYLNSLGERFELASTDRLARSEAHRFADSFLARLEHFNAFVADVYGPHDAGLRASLKNAICKTFAATTGSALGFMYMDRLRLNAADQTLVDAINNELRAGV